MKAADEELVALAKNGDTKAFEELVDRYKQKAYHIAFDFARDREEAKDLSQDAFLKAYMNIKKFDGRSGFYTWFYRILVNVCLDYRRLSRKIGAALEALPPKQRTAFILRNHEGLSIREIAQMMQTAEGTVKVHLHRAVAALRQSLAEFA